MFANALQLLVWPIWAIYRLIALILELTGRIAAAVIGGVLILVGILVSLTVVGAIIGIPLALFGLLLLIRALF